MAITMFTTTWCGYCQRLTAQLEHEGIDFLVVDIEQEAEGAELVEHANGGSRTVPTLLFEDGSTLTNPTVKQVREHLAGL